MTEKIGLIIAEHAWLRGEPEDKDGVNRSGIEDEIFSGWAVKMLDENHGKEYVKVETHYGYTGYVKRNEILEITEEELKRRQNREKFFRIRMGEVDLLDQPKVQGLPLELLLKNSIVELVEKEAAEGWSQVCTASGKMGYIHTDNLKQRRDDDGFLFLCTQKERTAYFCNGKEEIAAESNEQELRKRVTESACEFLGTQYRWGGKSSQGIDCSGLVFMSYLDQGILIYRDANLMEEYPVREIQREELKKGDLIFFPGHVAMYLGEEKYIHATGYVKTPYVTINSLRETDPDFRADLADKITGYGSIFK